MKKQGYNSRLKVMDKKTSGHAYGVVDKSVSGKKDYGHEYGGNDNMSYECIKNVSKKITSGIRK